MHFRMSLVCCSPFPSHTSWPLTNFRGIGNCSFKMSRVGFEGGVEEGGAAGDVVGVFTVEPLPLMPGAGGEGETMPGGLTDIWPGEGGIAPPKCLVSFMWMVRAWREAKLSLHQTHLNISLLLSGPRLIHWDCHALWRGPRLGLMFPDDVVEAGDVAELLEPPLAISLILSRGFLGSNLLADVGIPGIPPKPEANEDGFAAAAAAAAAAKTEASEDGGNPAASPAKGNLDSASGVRLPDAASKGLRNGKAAAPAEAAHGPNPGNLASVSASNFGILATGPSGRPSSAANFLLPDKSSGDSPVLNWPASGALGEVEGLLFDKFKASSESSFRFRVGESDSSSPDALLAAASCCNPPCDNNCAAWSCANWTAYKDGFRVSKAGLSRGLFFSKLFSADSESPAAPGSPGRPAAPGKPFSASNGEFDCCLLGVLLLQRKDKSIFCLSFSSILQTGLAVHKSNHKSKNILHNRLGFKLQINSPRDPPKKKESEKKEMSCNDLPIGFHGF